eukprot:scaffold3823_cov195-Amphora_coffeaeformis.AAC.28
MSVSSLFVSLRGMNHGTSGSLLPAQLESRNNESTAHYYDPFPVELKELVRQWREESIKNDTAYRLLLQQAAKVLSGIIRSKSYQQQYDDDETNKQKFPGMLFIKTHKTGSSTVTSVLHGLATAHNWSAPVIDIKIKGVHPGVTWKAYNPRQLDKMIQLSSTPTIPPLDYHHPNNTNLDATNRTRPFDIWLNHVVYDNKLFHHNIVRPNAKIVSIVRDPATRLRSACHFYGCCPKKRDDPTVWESYVLNIPNNNSSATPELQSGACMLDQSSHEIVGTGVEPDRGFQHNYETLLTRIHAGEILMLVTERMLESMLAMQYDFQLNVLDVAFLSQKVSKRTPTVKTKECLAAEERVRNWSPYDTRLHKIANEALTVKMSSLFGNDIQQERLNEAIWLLDGLNDLIYHVCMDADAHGGPNRKRKKKQKTPFDPVLAYWCSEKKLDNVEWNMRHSQSTPLGSQKNG